MAEVNDAYPELQRDLRFFPLGVDEPKTLTKDQIAHYNERGFIAPIRLFDDAEITEIRAYFDELLPQALAAGWDNYEITNWHKYCRGIWGIVTQPRLLDHVQDLLGETVIIRHSHFFAKLPGDGKQVSWHQDASYWPLSPSKVVTAWLAIDDCDLENGALQIIPRSHTNAQIPFEPSKPEENNVLNQTVAHPERYGESAYPLELKAGEMSLHSDWLLHGSEVNRSDRRRCGLAMRYLSSDVRAFNGWNEHSVICRGTDPSGHWANHPRPDREFIPSKAQTTTAPPARETFEESA
ncbi:MAG: phytanoyl-CoA dioxygenase family protein [Pseudomonadota bacterium]